MDFEPIDRIRVYSEIVGQIRDAIVSGQLKAGERLPTERELAERFQVSRSTVREALSVLSKACLVQIRSGCGIFVSNNELNEFAGSWDLKSILETNNSRELMEIRRIIEPIASELAAERLTKDEAKYFRELAELIESKNGSGFGEEEIQLDRTLHFSIAKATKNMVLVKIMNSVAELYQESLKEYRKITMMSRSRVSEIRIEHLAIIDAIISKDGESARQLMKKHLEFVRLPK